jgi:hypothetical protein
MTYTSIKLEQKFIFKKYKILYPIFLLRLQNSTCKEQKRFYISVCLSVYLFSCCSNLEQRASVKRFVSLQFLNLRQSVGLFGWGISPSQGRYLTKH